MVAGKFTWLTKGGGRERNEGTGFEGRVEGSFERQDWKEGITREIRNLKRFAMKDGRFLRNKLSVYVCMGD